MGLPNRLQKFSLAPWRVNPESEGLDHSWGGDSRGGPARQHAGAPHLVGRMFPGL